MAGWAMCVPSATDPFALRSWQVLNVSAAVVRLPANQPEVMLSDHRENRRLIDAGRATTLNLTGNGVVDPKTN